MTFLARFSLYTPWAKSAVLEFYVIKLFHEVPGIKVLSNVFKTFSDTTQGLIFYNDKCFEW